MRNKQRTLFDNNSHGGMLVELLLSIALAAMVIPFVFKYHQTAIERAQNIAVTRRMEMVQNALERYIVANREELMRTVGRNIVRVNITDLADYGLAPAIIDEDGTDYQLRVLKSGDATGQATLQGVIVWTRDDISPLRTRHIVNTGGDRTGFIEGNSAYGAFGAWRTYVSDIGVGTDDGIVRTTNVTRGAPRYLWRVPSDDASDATMAAPLDLAGHNILDAAFFNARGAEFSETLNVGRLVAGDVVFQNRTTLDKAFESTTSTVSGTLSADSRNMNVAGKFSLADTGKFSNFTVNDLYASNMTLSGFSISSDVDLAVLKVTERLDMSSGRIDAIFATVGFTGSITPRLVVRERIEDSVNSAYFWDVSLNVAHFADVSFAELTRMAPVIARRENVGGTVSSRIFGSVATNKNATAADFMNAIDQIQSQVRAKYHRLNLD